MSGPARIRVLVAACGIALVAAAADASDIPADATPAWIWADGRDAARDVTLRARFDVTAPERRVRLRCAADFCRVEVLLNGEPVLTLEYGAPQVDEDVTRHLRRGGNAVELRCTGSVGPSAVAIELDGVAAGDGSDRFLSGERWEARATDGASAADGWRPAASFGRVAPEEWGIDVRSVEIGPFDDYEQWRRAADASRDADAPDILAPAGFEVDVLRTARDGEGSWIALAFDPEGRPVVAREDKGLLRMTPTPDRAGIASVETIDDSLLECRGLLFAHDALYVNANNSKGLYRLRDTDGDDRFDEVTLLREFAGGVGHGRNDLALGPDGMIYSIHGDDVDLPDGDALDRTSPFREARRGARTREGHLIRTDRDGSTRELVASGLRNPFGIDFHPDDGEPFTYDADAEHDMGAPWYRPTRLVHLVGGADYGWRGVTGDWPPYFPDRPDAAPAAADVGKGSPTAVKFGGRSHFPPRFRRALFVLDWAYGRVIAAHLLPSGAGYRARSEVFLSGRPLNVTDLEFGPDGAMYLVTGGRKTASTLYRVRYVGPATAAIGPTEHEQARDAHSREMRAARRRLEAYHGRADAAAVAAAWPYLDHPDPVLRHAARVAVEHQPVAAWQARALAETRTTASLTALLALARAGRPEARTVLLRRLNEHDLTTLTGTQLSTALGVYSLCLPEPAGLEGDLRAACLDRLTSAFRVARPKTVGPVGTGGPATLELARLLATLDAPGLVADGMARLDAATSQEERLDWLFVLRHERAGWTPESRRSYFVALNDAVASFDGGRGMPGFLQTIREEAARTLTDAERRELGALADGPAAGPDAEPLPQRPFVRDWTIEDLADALEIPATGRDLERGRRMFHEAACDRCHRAGTGGAAAGPDLTGVGRRFGRRDVLESILSPSKVVAEPYRNVEVVTADGRVVVGRVAAGGDYRASVLRIVPDPLRPSQVVEIPKADVELHRESPVSPMPAGLLRTLTRDEIVDLLAFLETGGARRPAPETSAAE